MRGLKTPKYIKINPVVSSQGWFQEGKYLKIELYFCPYVSIHISQPYFTQLIINMIPVMDNSVSNLNPAIKPPLVSSLLYASYEAYASYEYSFLTYFLGSAT